MSRDADAESLQAQYRGGCGADSLTTDEYIPETIPDEAYVVQDGEDVPFPENPKTAIPSNETLQETSVDEIVTYLADTIPKFADRLEREYLDELQAMTGESADMLSVDLDLIRRLADPDRLRGWLRTGSTDLGAYLESWQSTARYDVRAEPIGRGVNVNAGHNVGAVVIPELWRALTKNAVLHKMPGSDQVTLRALAETYADNPHPVAESFTVAYWPGGAEGIERNLYSADYAMAWGDDGTITAIQQRVSPTTRFVPFHFEFGTYLVDEATQREYDESLLREVAADFSWGDQLLCFSPLLMIVEECETTEQFLTDLADAMEAYATEYEPGVVPEEEQMKRTRTKRMARDYGELVSDWDADTTVVLKEGLTAADLAEFHSFRFVEAHSVDRLEDAIEVVGSNPNLQEFVLATTTERGNDLRNRIAPTNAKRIAAPGGAAPTEPIPWDGKQPAAELVKWLSDER